MHMKKWLKEGYKPLLPKGSKQKVEEHVKMLKKKGVIKMFKLAKCMTGDKWEAYVK